jgi:hypothetical protein
VSPQKINRISVWLLSVGLVAAIAVFCTTSPDSDDDPLRDFKNSKKYSREMRMIGGKANEAASEFVDDFIDLWHGRELAGTLVVVTVLGTLLFRFVASHPDLTASAGESAGKIPPSGSGE